MTSTLALVLALSGTAYAAATVTSADIVNGTIQGLDIRTGAVATADIATGGVTGPDIAPNAVQTADIGFQTITNEDIADDAIETEVVQDGTLTADDLGTGSVASDEIVDGSVAPEDLAAPVAPPLFAVVDASGAVLNSSPGVTATAVNPGSYQVTFAQDVTNCAAVASVQSTTTKVATILFIGGQRVDVVTALPSNGAAEPSRFHLAVLC
ncbi:MAG TPA: hypothetical protein VD926_14865 [Acidimicrobiales bacterium]|nr:hypothetical protein [Acidimicrobiales bacterium]